MGKKKPEEMASLKSKFIEGGKKHYNSEDIGKLFDQIAGFAEYGFNRSHSICYSIITAQTAWLSNYYPLEFYTTLLTIDSDNTDDVRRYISAIKQRGFSVSAPRINSADLGFTIDSGKDILFGLSGIKGVGKAVSNKLLKRRPKKGYRSLGHFVIKNLDVLNKKILESYAKAGVFKDFGINKASAMKSVQDILGFMDIQKSISEYYTLFDITKISLEDYFDTCLISKVDLEDPLKYEIETLGLYITKHPLEDYLINDNSAYEITYIKDKMAVDQKVRSVGAICNIDIRKTKAKTNMASFDLTSPTDSIRCVCFPKVYSDIYNELEEGRLVAVDAFLREDEGTKVLIINGVLDPSMHICKLAEKKNSWKPVLKLDREELFSMTEFDSVYDMSVVVNPRLEIRLERGK